MNDTNDDKPRRWLSFDREKDQKAIIGAFISALVLFAGLGGSGVLRWGKFDTDDGAKLEADAKKYADDNFVSKSVHSEKHSILDTRIFNIEKRDEEFRKDIRLQYKMITEVDAAHPPPWFEKKVNDNKLGLSELMLRVQHLEKVHALWAKAKGKQ